MEAGDILGPLLKAYDPRQPRIKRGLPGAGRWVSVFAYGTNLDEALMNLRAPGATKVSRAKLRGYKLEPTSPPNVERTGDPKDEVEGLVYRVPGESMASLDDAEGVKYSLYNRVPENVETPEGQRKVQLYRAPNGGAFAQGGKHTLAEYLRTLYRKHGLNETKIPGLQ
jgi:gamma-glutamylcyclotransferase (GGCT)/AIG2-like uncharacterized protein YtfP